MENLTDRLAGLSAEKRELLEALMRKKRAQAAAFVAIPPRDGTEGPLPLSFSQERLWLIDQLEPDSPAYNIPIALRFTGELKVDLLSRGLSVIVHRHESLRTRFEVHEGNPIQVIDPPTLFVLPLVDLEGLPPEAREEEISRLIHLNTFRPFDLRRGPVFRSMLVRLSRGSHLLLAAMHHIVSDGWSAGVFARELGLLYAGHASGRPASLPPLPIQYPDFALWQRRTLEGPVLEKQLDFWRQRLAGLDPVLELASDRPRPARRTARGDLLRFSLTEALSARVKELAAREGTTLFPTLLAAWLTLLHRQTDREDLAVGTPIAGRRRVETEGLIGFFVNTLVVRADLAGDPPFRQALARVHEAVLDAQANQDVPFERLVSELVTERSLSYAPIIQSLFTFQNTPGGMLELPGLEIEGLQAEIETTKFDLSLTMSEEGAQLLGGLEYSLDLFEPATVDRTHRQLVSLLEGVTADPEVRLSAIPLLTPAELRQILEEWAPGAGEPLTGACLHELFAAQAARTPDAVALICGEQRLTYAELAARAGGLAGQLRGLGVRPETRVAVCLERSPDLIVSLLGVLAAGGAYVPVDPAYPVERRALMLEDSGAAVLVTRGNLSADLPATGARVLDLDTEEIAPGALPDSGVTPGHLAYVIYTSGSTGRPKGVAIEHRSAVVLVGWALREFSAEELSGVLAATSVCFDLSVFEIFAPLAAGGTVILAENALELPRLPAASAVRLINTVPSAATELVRSNGLPPSVRTVNLAGEPLPAVLAERLYATGTIERVLNLYGPSEDTTYSTGAQAPRGGDRDPAIGRPLTGTRAYVLDRRGNPVPAGVAGELWLAGDGLARGYLGRPELTAERFVPAPFGSSQDGGRAYRTGDLTRFRADGELEFLGRIDHQVKVRGFRIELGEIETALRSHPGIRECVVVVREEVANAPGSRLLVAYLAGDAVPEVLELRAFLGKRLPEYMVPSAFVTLEALPLTPNGKIDRKALPAPDHTGEEDAYVAPTDPTEELIAGFWGEILNVPRVGIHDNFFALGGHSLLATQVISRIREVLGVELPQRMIFEAPTVAGLALGIREAKEAGTVPPPPIVPVPRDADLPLSFSQQRLWFLDKLEPGNPAYNIPLPVRLTGELQVDLLQRIFAEVVRRHEALRTTFDTREGQPVQVVAPELVPELPVHDLRDLPEAEREERARRLALEDAVRPFDLKNGPLLRLTLLRLAEREHVLLITMHHIVSDGWSMGVLLREIAALHPALSQGRPSPLPELPVQYGDFAAWQRSWMQGEVLEAQLAYWKEQLAGAPAVLELPLDRPRPAAQTYGGASQSRTLPPALSTALRDLCRRAGVTPFMVLLAAWSALLGRLAGQRDVLVGTPIAGRNRREIEGLIGFFVNSLVLRTDLSGGPGFAELLGRVRATALDAFAHQDLPFERIVEDVVPERNLSHSPLFQVMLVLQNAPRQDFTVPGLAFSPLELESRVARLDLTLTFHEGENGFAGVLEYNTDLFDGGTAERLLARFEALLEAATANPDLSVDELPVLLPAERKSLAEWNDTAVAYPTGHSLHELVAAQAARTPDAIAAVFEGETLTYRELDRRAEQLAHHLIRLGVAPDDRVGVLLERSLEMIVGLLGVLKAEAAYVPLDSSYPADRLAVLIRSAGASVVLAQGRLTHLLPNQGETVLLLDDPSSLPPLPEGREGVGERGRGGEGLAYVLFTSGSTGTPKGVMIPHQGIVNRLLWMQEAYSLTPDDRILQKTPFSFDVSLWEFFWPLLNGARLVFARPEGHRDPAYLAELIAREGITTLHFVPSMLQAFLEAPGLESLASLRRVMASGEALPPELVRRFFARLGRAGLHNLYGPTEASVDVTFWPCVPEPPRGVVPIGRPIANIRIHVVDRDLRPQPIGVPGELLLGGVGLARGYLGRPELTAAAFVPDPFGTAPGSRLYRTGDLTRLLPDGNVEYLGRIDHQVKIRGFRIELGEIEAVLGSHPTVRECVVVAREDTPGARLLAAYVVGAAGAEAPSLDIGALRTFLGERLPEYMVPAAFVVLEALPLSPNGKVDRKALPAPDRARRERKGEIIAPRTPTEEVLVEIWKELLGLEQVSVEDGFFELGGHSLLATQALTRVHQTFGVELPLREVFKRPTVAGLGELIDQQVRSATSDDELAALLDELDSLSDEETRARLEGLLPGTGES